MRIIIYIYEDNHIYRHCNGMLPLCATGRCLTDRRRDGGNQSRPGFSFGTASLLRSLAGARTREEDNGTRGCESLRALVFVWIDASEGLAPMIPCRRQCAYCGTRSKTMRVQRRSARSAENSSLVRSYGRPDRDGRTRRIQF